MLRLFYEGFTNKLMMPKFHNNSEVNDIVSGFAKYDETGQYWYIAGDDLNALASFLYKRFYNSKRKNLIDNITTYKDVRYSKSELQDTLRFRFNNF